MTPLDKKLLQCGIQPIKDGYRSFSPDQICTLEKALGAFPDEYKEILGKYGSALFDKEVMFSPIDSRYRRISSDGITTIDCIYGDIDNNDPWDPNSLQANREWMKGRMPDTMIPIARSGNGHICLCLHGPDKNALFYWDRVEEPTINNNNIYRIADSLADFISSLRCEET